jgi:spermidine/putrescine transport system substrate-binding protein
MMAPFTKGVTALNQQLPEDPMARDLIKMARRHQITRRAALAGAGATAATVALAACAPGGSTTTGLTPAKDLSESEKVITWDNWAAYLDGEEDSSYPTLKTFEKNTGIKVYYDPTAIVGNNEYYGAAEKQLLAGDDIGADTMCLTDWQDAFLIQSGLVQKLDLANIPNHKNMKAEIASPTFDQGREYSMPWMSFMTGIAYNKKLYKELTGKTAPTSVADLWDPALKGRVVLLSEYREAVGLILISQGIDISKVTEDQYMTAVDLVAKQVKDGQINTKGQGYIESFQQKNAVAGLVWSGDLEWGDEFGFVFDPKGATLNTDSFTVPMGAQHKTNVEKLINYYYDPEVSAKVILGGVVYAPPVEGVQEIVAKTDQALADNELIFPKAGGVRDKLHQFLTLTYAEHSAWNEAYNAATGV